MTNPTYTERPVFTHPDHRGISAQVIADSVSPDGSRITTMRKTHPRFILSEENTHGSASKSGASSRAISFARQVEALFHGPQAPIRFTGEQRGMSGAEVPDDEWQMKAEAAWWSAEGSAVDMAQDLHDHGVHKSLASRLLEPFTMHTSVWTATVWDNYLDQRDHPDAQPEMQALAQMVRAALDDSTPDAVGGVHDRPLHLPFVAFRDLDDIADVVGDSVTLWSLAAKVSTARVARTSYLGLNGERDVEADLRLYDRLVDEQIRRGAPVHVAPMEQVAAPAKHNRQAVTFTSDTVLGTARIDTNDLPRIGKYVGWISYRHIVEARLGTPSYR